MFLQSVCLLPIRWRGVFPSLRLGWNHLGNRRRRRGLYRVIRYYRASSKNQHQVSFTFPTRCRVRSELYRRQISHPGWGAPLVIDASSLAVRYATLYFSANHGIQVNKNGWRFCIYQIYISKLYNRTCLLRFLTRPSFTL